MSKPINIITILVFLANILLSTSCKDDNTYYSYNKGIEATSDYVGGQQMMALILNTYFKSISDSLLLTTGKSNIDGANVYYGGGEYDTLRISYPAWGTDDGYDHWRNGDIKVAVNQGFFNTDADYSFQFIDFFYDKDSIRVDNLSLRYMGKDGQNDLFSVTTDTIQQLFRDSSGVHKFWMNQSFLRYKDASSIYYTLQDKFEIYGKLDGESREETEYFTETPVEQAFLNQFDCSFLKQAAVHISFSDTTYTGTVYFSEPDSCINQYIVDFQGNPFPDLIYKHDW